MRLLLDECTPRRIRKDFAGHEVFTVEQAGLKGFKNGQLLRAASGSFDALITVDQNMIHQQNLASLSIAILVLVAHSNRYEALQPLIPQALNSLQQINPGEIVRIETPRGEWTGKQWNTSRSKETKRSEESSRSSPMIKNNQGLAATLERIRYFQQQVEKLRDVETNPQNFC